MCTQINMCLNINVTFRSVWYDSMTKVWGLHYCNFIFRPDLIDWRSVRTRVVRDRLESAFHVAEREYGVTRLLDPEGENTSTFVQVGMSVKNITLFTWSVWTFSTSRCTGFTKSFPSLMVSSCSSYFFPLNSLFLQNLIYPFVPHLSFVSLPLCSSFPAHCGVSLLYLILIVLFTFKCHLKRGLAWKFLYKQYHWQFIHRHNCVWRWVCLSGHSFSLPFTLIRWTTQFPWHTVNNVFEIIWWIKCLALVWNNFLCHCTPWV